MLALQVLVLVHLLLLLPHHLLLPCGSPMAICKCMPGVHRCVWSSGSPASP